MSTGRVSKHLLLVKRGKTHTNVERTGLFARYSVLSTLGLGITVTQTFATPALVGAIAANTSLIVLADSGRDI
jgi:hypothetical protein